MNLMITGIYAAIFAIIVVPLSMQITMRRIALGNIAFGDANDGDLICKREALRNFSEYVPLGMILLAVSEYHLGQTIAVVLFGGLFLFSRIVHAIGTLYSSTPLLRAIAMMIQHISFISISLVLLYTLLM